MDNSKFLYRVYDLYRDGFRKMISRAVAGRRLAKHAESCYNRFVFELR